MAFDCEYTHGGDGVGGAGGCTSTCLLATLGEVVAGRRRRVGRNTDAGASACAEVGERETRAFLHELEVDVIVDEASWTS